MVIYYILYVDNFVGNEIKALLTAAEIGNLEKMKTIVQAVEEFEMKENWIRQGDKKRQNNFTPCLHLWLHESYYIPCQ